MTEIVTTATAPTPGRRRLTAGLAVLAWCAAVAVAATVGWLVVSRAGVSLLGGSGPGLTNGVPAATAPASSTTTSAAPGQPVTRNTTGGRVTASCTPAGLITLGGAVPAQDWRMEVSGSGTRALEVEFRKGARKVEVQGTCRAGIAVLTLDRSGSGSGSGSPTTTTPRPATSTDNHGGGSGGGSDDGAGDSHGGSSGGGSGSGSGGSGSGGSGSGSGKSGGGSDDG